VTVYPPHPLAMVTRGAHTTVQVGPHVVRARLTSPNMVDRGTGRFRDPDRCLDLDASVLTTLTRLHSVASPRFVVAVYAHVFTRRAAVLGPFTSSIAADLWWALPANVLRRDSVFVIAHTTWAPVKDGTGDRSQLPPARDTQPEEPT
jgi:hypothetical protein